MSYRGSKSVMGKAEIKPPAETVLTLEPASIDKAVPHTQIFKGRLTEKETGNPVVGKQIRFVVNDEMVDLPPIVTDSNGAFTFQYTFEKVGSYVYLATYEGD